MASGSAVVDGQFCSSGYVQRIEGKHRARMQYGKEDKVGPRREDSFEADCDLQAMRVASRGRWGAVAWAAVGDEARRRSEQAGRRWQELHEAQEVS